MLKPLEETGTLRLEEADAGGRHPLQGAIAYTAFGLSLRVDPRIYVPGLERAQTVAVAEPPTSVWVDAEGLRERWDSLDGAPRRMRELRIGTEVLLSVDFEPSAGYLLSASGYGRFLISPDGTQLVCDPVPERQDWAAILGAQPLPLAATLRGLEPLHASGIVRGGRARIFAGPPGAGKSSLAAALVRGGAGLIADDVAALELREGQLMVHPGPGAVHLRENEAQRVANHERALPGAPTPAIGGWRCTTAAVSAPVPFAELFLLERSERGPIVEAIDPVDPFALLSATYTVSVRTPARLERQLAVVDALAASGGVFRLRIRPGMDADGLAARLEERFAASAS